jgi:hypothetical protein
MASREILGLDMEWHNERFEVLALEPPIHGIFIDNFEHINDLT